MESVEREQRTLHRNYVSTDRLDEAFRDAFVEPLDTTTINTRRTEFMFENDINLLEYQAFKVERTYSGAIPQYRLILERQAGEDRLLMVAKRSILGESKYKIYAVNSQNEEETLLGHMKPNLLGISFILYQLEGMGERDVLLVQYEPNVLGPKLPRSIKVVLPSLNLNGHMNTLPTQTNMTEILAAGNPGRVLCELRNKVPQWNQDAGSFVLNFEGRVLLTSVKNFQIIHEHDMHYIVLQFGKLREDVFNLDFQYPLSFLQAFAIALTSFDAKIGCE